jgi:hypothetical protein
VVRLVDLGPVVVELFRVRAGHGEVFRPEDHGCAAGESWKGEDESAWFRRLEHNTKTRMSFMLGLYILRVLPSAGWPSGPERADIVETQLRGQGPVLVL